MLRSVAGAVAAGLLLAGCGDAPAMAGPPPGVTAARPAVTATAAALPTPAPILLPQDDGPHQALTEWWYYNGHLATEDGQRFSFHLVVFKRQGQGPAPRSAYVAHVGITDHQSKAFRYDQVLVVPPPLPELPGRFDLAVGPVVARGGDGRDAIAGGAGEYAFTLTLQAEKPPVIHGDAGIVGVSPGERSYYYSRTRMAAAGTLRAGGQEMPVQGTAWMDHQWGDFSLPGAAGWDWFALQLDDGTDLMVSVLRDSAGAVAAQYGTWVEADGQARALGHDDLQVAALGRWTSPATGAIYPMGWRLEVPGHGLTAELAPVLPEQEVDSTATTGKVYWEGATAVRGLRAGRPVAGWAYVELTGYKERTAP